MKYYFEIKENREKLEAILKSWEGTPYRHWSGVKKGGCDCIHFVIKVIEELGFGPFKIEKYPCDWHIHNNKELLLEGINRQLVIPGIAEKVDVDNPIDGDIILYKFGRVLSHSGLYYKGRVYQALDGIGVQSRRWEDKIWFVRKKHNYRILL